jgi:hypothetical protein
MAVTTVSADKNILCPGEKVTVSAKTDGSTVNWLIDGAPARSTEANTISFFGLHGTTVVFTADDGESRRSVSVTWKQAGVRVCIEPSSEILITDKPGMEPSQLTVTAKGIGGSLDVSNWSASAGTSNFLDCPDGPVHTCSVLEFVMTDTSPKITLDFGDEVIGMFLRVFVSGNVNGCPVSGGDVVNIRGTNPKVSEIQKALPHATLRRIACLESGQRQFNAPPDGGIGICPLFGPNGKVGILQIPALTHDEIWNWRKNVERGVQLFNQIFEAAQQYPRRVRASSKFSLLVKRFNQRRTQEGLAALDISLPDFSTGNFDDDLQQLQLDTIRGFNGWFGSDRFGQELHEFEVGVDDANGEEFLRVTNINEETKKGTAVWERVSPLKRPQNPGRPNYVDDVLKLPPVYSLPPFFCPLIDVNVHASDSKTHRIFSKAAFHSNYVTVRGTGDIVLQATVIPDRSEFVNKLSWEATGGTITSPAVGNDPLTAKISRDTGAGKRIKVSIKVGNVTCHTFDVWIIWCTLTPNIDPNQTSSIGGVSLGLKTFSNADFYDRRAGIDWLATIQPPEIITDPLRPGLEDQRRVSPPGNDIGVAGEPIGNSRSGFSGWDMSRQARIKVVSGNKNTSRQIKRDERVYPPNDVQGNDDPIHASISDTNPYDKGIGVPRKSKSGTLRSHHRPGRSFEHAKGKDGDFFIKRLHFREFVRIQLGNKWYRCSDFGVWIYHVFASRKGGKWGPTEGSPDIFDVIDLASDDPFYEQELLPLTRP